VTGYFVVIGLADEAFIYKVRTIRDGGNYSVRQIDVCQEDGVICFTGICSFKKSDAKFMDIQVRQNMEEKYSALLGGKKAAELPINSNFKDLR
jgi:acyl-CoA thioesterase